MNTNHPKQILILTVTSILLTFIIGSTAISNLFAAEAKVTFLPIILASGEAALATPTPPPSSPTPSCQSQAENLLVNPSFENETSEWSFNSKNGGQVGSIDDAFHCKYAVRISLSGSGGTTQFFQTNVVLQPNTTYRLSFAARATDELAIRADLLQHVSPFTQYGLYYDVELTREWQEFTVDFTTIGFNNKVEDGRFRFRILDPKSGNQYDFDNVTLIEVGTIDPATATPTIKPTQTPKATPTLKPSATPTNTPQATATPTSGVNKPVILSFSAEPATIQSGETTTLSWVVTGENVTLTINKQVGSVTGTSAVNVSPTSTTTYRLTASNSAGSVTEQATVTVSTGGGGGGDKSRELLVYDWNGQVTEAEKGFPRNTPPLPSSNIDWTSPRNYAEGTLYFRVQIRNQPKPQDMQLQYCIWQDNHVLENCAPKEAVRGTSGNVVTWSGDVDKMWMKNNESIDWTRPRMRDGIAIKNSQGKPVSPIGDFNWAGEDPKEWYPINWRFTIVVVPKGEPFSGWGNWIN